MRTFVQTSLAVLALSIPASAYAQIQPIPPRTPIQPQVPQLPTGQQDVLRGGLQVPRCHVDPAISRVTLSRNLSAGTVQITIEVVNRGRSGNWVSGRHQQVLSFYVQGRNGLYPLRGQSILPEASVPPGGTIMVFSSNPRAYEFRRGSTESHALARIDLDPDIYIDGNPCNDDADLSNNELRVSNAELAAFFQSPDRTRSFRQ